MWEKFVCLLLGHDYAQQSEYTGMKDNGLAGFEVTLGNCIRCKKAPKKEK